MTGARVLVLGLLLAACAGEPSTALQVNISGAFTLKSLGMSLTRDQEIMKYALPPDGSAPTLPGSVRVRLGTGAAHVEVEVVGVTTADEEVSGTGAAECAAQAECVVDIKLSLGGGKLGAACTGPADCASGFCAGMVCCDTACDSPCATCKMIDGAKADGTCGVRAAGTVCRAAVAGGCDADDVCDGVSAQCVDQLKPFGTVCRPAILGCDVEETCTGASPTCPANQSSCPPGQYCGFSGCAAKVGAGVSCVDGFGVYDMCTSGICNGACCTGACAGGCQRCTLSTEGGTPGSCVIQPGGYACRPAATQCDVPETCDGASVDCPADKKKNTTKATYMAEATGAGTVNKSPASLVTTELNPHCLASGNPYRAFASFDTTALTVTGVADATLTMCRKLSSNAPAQLLDVPYTLPISTATYDAVATMTSVLPDVPAAAGIEKITVPTAFVHPGARTQLGFRLVNETCGPASSRAWVLFGAGNPCGAQTSPPVLTIEYCTD